MVFLLVTLCDDRLLAAGDPLQNFQSLLKRLTAEVDAIKPPAQEFSLVHVKL